DVGQGSRPRHRQGRVQPAGPADVRHRRLTQALADRRFADRRRAHGVVTGPVGLVPPGLSQPPRWRLGDTGGRFVATLSARGLTAFATMTAKYGRNTAAATMTQRSQPVAK